MQVYPELAWFIQTKNGLSISTNCTINEKDGQSAKRIGNIPANSEILNAIISAVLCASVAYFRQIV